MLTRRCAWSLSSSSGPPSSRRRPPLCGSVVASSLCCGFGRQVDQSTRNDCKCGHWPLRTSSLAADSAGPLCSPPVRCALSPCFCSLLRRYLPIVRYRHSHQRPTHITQLAVSVVLFAAAVASLALPHLTI